MAGGPTQALRAPDGEGEVEVRFGVGPLLWDPRTWRFQAHNEIVWRRGERTRTVRYPSAGKVHHPLEVSALVDAVGGIEMLALLGSYELDHPLAVGDDRAVFVLRRRPEA